MKEAIYIRVNNPIINKNIGKDNLPQIWDKVQFFFHLRTKSKIKIPQHHNICASRGLPKITDLCTPVPHENHNKNKNKIQ